MTVINEDYMYLIIKKISNLHDIPIEGSINRLDYNKVYNRAGLIFALEVVLEEHRNTYATSWSPLKGKIALQHLLLMKYKWTLDIINMLKLQDVIMLLQEELNYNKLPESAQKILSNFRAYKLVDYFPTISDAEWDPDLIEQLPKTIQW
ncbi:ECs1072 family phage-associated protein [Morganella morganii]|uniref:ECs1072 family phage-associated protein n=1 Tax=Morganella morganii TaxID=582 RepID=UPI001BD965A8|nr:hypothetical protein [Morganella morganii]MBT0306466.1 hypothetical protein [Morganella morganii subsp. morganii]